MRKVVVVEDDRDTREYLQYLLSSKGYEVLVVPNGLKLMGALHVDRPDVILLDVMLSWIDGFDLCASLKRNPDFADVPVIFVSAKTNKADVDRGLECGAAAYVTKPFEPRDLLAALDRVLADRPPRQHA